MIERDTPSEIALIVSGVAGLGFARHVGEHADRREPPRQAAVAHAAQPCIVHERSDCKREQHVLRRREDDLRDGERIHRYFTVKL